MKTFIEMLEGVYSSDYKVKEFVGKDGKTHTRKSHPRRIVDDEAKKDEMKEQVEFRIDHRDKATGDHKSTFADHEAKVSDTTDKATYVKVPSHKADSFKSAMKSKHGVKVELAESRNQADKYYDEAEKHKVEAKKHKVGSEEHHHHMSNHYDAMHRYHSDIGQHSAADKAADKAEEHHEKSLQAEGNMKTFKNHIVHNMPTNEEVELTIEEQLHEVLSKDAEAGDWISDFVKSDNPKFEGKSKKERIQMALGAYYGKQKNESYNDNRTGFGRREREDDEYHVPDPTPVAPTLHRKYIKGTPEHKAHKALHKPINGHPTGKYNEEVEEIEEAINADHYHATSEPSQFGGHRAIVKHKEKGTTMYAGQHRYATKEKAAEGAHKYLSAYENRGANSASDAAHAHAKINAIKESLELDEKFINGREYASHGLMHPDHAKMDIHKVSGQHVDFYASKTGDKMQGKVTKNDGKSVHIQAHKDKELGDGKLHKFKVTPHLPKQNNEEFENGELETTMKSYKEFMESLDEALWPGTPEYNKKFGGGAKREVGAETKTAHGKAIGTGTGVKHERDYDKAEKETPAPASTEKRGRGRPAGSTSGARQKGTIAKSEYAGADYTGHKLHLPNSNR